MLGRLGKGRGVLTVVDGGDGCFAEGGRVHGCGVGGLASGEGMGELGRFRSEFRVALLEGFGCCMKPRLLVDFIL